MMEKMGPDYLDQDGPNDLRTNIPRGPGRGGSKGSTDNRKTGKNLQSNNFYLRMVTDRAIIDMLHIICMIELTYIFV